MAESNSSAILEVNGFFPVQEELSHANLYLGILKRAFLPHKIVIYNLIWHLDLQVYFQDVSNWDHKPNRAPGFLRRYQKKEKIQTAGGSSQTRCITNFFLIF